MTLLDGQDLASYINEARQMWCIPAVSVTLVDLDKGASATKGFGHPSSGPVDEHSIWSICSNTKLFTVFALAILVEEGKLSWDSKLNDLLPELKLQDSHASETLTLEDILSHRSGIPSYTDAEFSKYGKPSNIVTIMSAVRSTMPALKQFQYNNGFFCLAGYLISCISGSSYTDFVTEKILIPLGMMSSSFGQPVHKAKVVSPYVAIPGFGSHEAAAGFQDVPVDNIALPTGGLLSSRGDLEKWLSYLLRLARDECRADDPKIVTPDTFREVLRSRGVSVEEWGGIAMKPGEARFPELSPLTYALGQWRCHYRGIDLAFHLGSGPGAGSILLFMAQKNFALAVTTNVCSAAWNAAPAIAFGLVDRYLGLETVDWVERMYALQYGPDAKLPSPPSANTGFGSAEYTRAVVTGTYYSPAFGPLTIFPLDQDPATLSEEAARKLGLLKRAKSFGPVFEEKPHYIGIYERGSIFFGYLAIHHIRGAVHWGVAHYLAAVPSHARGEEEVVDVPNPIAVHADAGQYRLDFLPDGHLEWYNSFREGETGIGKGNATFTRRE